jgi:hypothetical protein
VCIVAGRPSADLETTELLMEVGPDFRSCEPPTEMLNANPLGRSQETSLGEDMEYAFASFWTQQSGAPMSSR